MQLAGGAVTVGSGRFAAPTLGAPVRCTADARAVWRQHMGDRPVSVPSAREWLDNAYRLRAEQAALRLADLAASGLYTPDELVAFWRAAGAELVRALGEYRRAVGDERED